MTVHNFGVSNLKFYIKITTLIRQPTLIKVNQIRRHSCFPKQPNLIIHAFPNKKTNEKKNKTEK